MESSLIINTASFKKCSGQAGLPGSLPPCAETLAGEDANSVSSWKTNEYYHEDAINHIMLKSRSFIKLQSTT